MTKKNDKPAAAPPATTPPTATNAGATTDSNTALVPLTGGTPSLPLPDDLAEELYALDALEDLEQEDRPIPFKSFNVKLKDAEGKWIPRDVFFDTTAEDTVPVIDAVLLHLRKARRHAFYEEAVGSTKVLCRSNDCKIGVQENGETRVCETCHLKEWAGGEKPKCGIVYNLVGLDLNNGLSPFVVRAKATSLAPTRKYIAKWFGGKLKLKDGRTADLPLFVYKTRLSLEMPTGNYAVLQFENLGPCTEEEIRYYKSLFAHFQNNAKVDAAVEAEAPEAAGGAVTEEDDETPEFLRE